MNKSIHISLLLLILACVGSCSDDASDLSRYRLEFNEEFRITEIQISEDGDIYCLGYRGWVDSMQVRTYDQDLNFIRQIDLFEKRGVLFLGDLVHLHGGGWMGATNTAHADHGTVDLIRFDEEFNTIATKEIYRGDESFLYANSAQDLLRTSTGEFVLAWDTMSVPVQGERERGYLITKFTEDLEVLWTYQGDSVGNEFVIETPGSPILLELDNGDIAFYSSAFSGFVPFTLLGRLDPDGKLDYLRIFDYETLFNSDISITESESSFLTYSTEDQEQKFVRYNKATGDFEEEVRIPFYDEAAGWSSITMPEFPPDIKDETGVFLFSTERQKLFFQKVGVGLELTKGFDLMMPPFEDIFACKYHPMDDGGMIVGVTFQQDGKEHFTIMRLDSEGNLQ